jgi:hydrogenase/urease accessory protein HupE
MSLALRWLLIFGVLLGGVLRTASVAAHPLLEDALDITTDADTVQIDVRSTLRPVVVALGAKPQEGSYFSVLEMLALVRAHAAYLSQHLTLRLNDRVVLTREARGERVEETTAPVQEHVDLERLHAHFTLVYPSHGVLQRLSLEQDMLSEAPGDRSWHLSYIVSVRQHGDPTLLASGLLTRERGFDFETLAAQSAGAQSAGAQSAGAQSAGAHGAPHDFFGYFLAGIRHILSGWDHLMFVSALVLATRRLAELVKVVLAFTVAHSLTLTLAVLHLVHLPESVVEPLIALSIVLVSLENLLSPEHGAGAMRLAVAFGFGLIHGLGFAGPLVDALQGAPASALATGIVGFSAGVELGHQLVVLPLFFAVTRLARTTQERSFSLTLRVGSLITALGGAFFLVRAVQTFVLA